MTGFEGGTDGDRSEQCDAFRIAVLISGSGRSLANLIRAIAENGWPIEVTDVIASRDDIAGLTIAKQAGISTTVVRKKGRTDDEFCEAVFERPRDHECDLVVMAGFLQHVRIPDDFAGRVINIHPSLLPAFGGAGMYGHHVHEAAIERGVKVSGCTVHYVDNHYDNGPIIDQRWCLVRPDDDADALAARVFKLECDLLPATVHRLSQQRVG